MPTEAQSGTPKWSDDSRGFTQARIERHQTIGDELASGAQHPPVLYNPSYLRIAHLVGERANLISNSRYRETGDLESGVGGLRGPRRHPNEASFLAQLDEAIEELVADYQRFHHDFDEGKNPRIAGTSTTSSPEH